jgi:hypothetical protein
MEKDEWEEKLYQLCCGFTGLYHRRAVLVSEGKTEKAKMFDEAIQILCEDIENWVLKNG